MKKSVKRILMSVIVAIGLVASVGLGFFVSVHAAASYVEKGVQSALLICYGSDVFKPNVKAKAFSTNNKQNADIFIENDKTWVYVPINSEFFSIKDLTTSVTCKSLIEGLIKNNKITVPTQGSSGEEIKDFMESLGYTNKNNASGVNAWCFNFKYGQDIYKRRLDGTEEKQSHEVVTTKSICANLSDSKADDNSKITGALRVENTATGYANRILDFEAKNITNTSSKIEIRVGGDKKLCKEVNIELNTTTWKELKEKVRDNIIDYECGGAYPSFRGNGLFDLDTSGSFNIIDLSATGVVEIFDTPFGDSQDIAEYKIDSSSKEAKNAAMITFFSSNTSEKPQFGDDEIFLLYQAYLNKFYQATIKYEDELTEQQKKSVGYSETKVCKGGKLTKAYVVPGNVQAAAKNVGLVDSEGHFGKDYCSINGSIEGNSFKCIANWLNNYDDGDDVCSADPGSDPSNPGGSDKKDDSIVDCNQLKTIGAMQWVLCPAMNGMQYSANALDKWTEEQLSVNTKLFDMNNSGEGSAGHRVYKAWGYIRNIANVLMIVFLLIIIFSQLTGRGIDNYGIKKMLPRLIVMAIVVNLSYYICELAIDLSNIFGVGLRGMFGATGNAVAPVDGLSYVGGMIAGAFATMITASGAPIATAARVGIALADITGPVIAIVLAVVVALLLIIVAIFVLFIMLGIRQILIVVCLLLSPLAFVAYILPNTQNLFKSWWNLFKACLIIFPLCGAFSGISYLLKSTVGNSTSLGVPGSLVMMVLPYVIFFLLPMLLKSAIAALGKIGGALTALGGTVKSGAQSWGRAATGVAKNTEAYKNRQLEIAKRRQAKSADRTIAKLGEIEEKNLSPEEKLRLARAHETKRKLAQEDTAAETILMEKKYAGMSETALLKGLRTAIDNGDAGNVKALSNVLVSRGGNGAINKIGNMIGETEFFDKEGEFVGGDNGAMARSFNALRENLQENKTLNTGTLNKTSDVYQMLTGGGYDAEGEHRYNLYYHSKHNDLTTQAKDLATQSSDTIRRAIAGGGMSPELFNSVLTSEDPAIQSGILSEDSKANLLKAGSMGYAGDLSDAKAVAASAAKYDLAHPDASSVKFTGKQLADYSVDELRTLANRAINDGVGSEAYKKFVAASNEIAQSPELLTNLSADKKAEIHRVRIANNSNDRVFANNTEMNIDHRGNGADFISE